MTTLRTAFAALIVLTLALLIPQAEACVFCFEQKGPTLAEDFTKSQVVLHGSCVNAKPSANGLEGGSTDFVIEEILKGAEHVNGKKIITLPRFIPDSKHKHVIFADVYKGKLDFYRGVALESGSAMVTYLKGAFALQDKDKADRLRFFFDYLNSPEQEITLDAYREYAKADYKDYEAMAKTLPKATLVAWLTDPKTPAYRLGLFSSLLGHCGGPEEAKLLKSMIEDPEKRKGSGIDGMMAGLVMIDPQGGWAFLSEQMLNPKQEFLYRYSAFRTARFLWDVRPDLVPKEILVKSMAGLAQVGDIADFGIDELRKWKRWEFTPQILALYDQKSHDSRSVRSAILRFALRSPEPAAIAFVAEQRRRDPERVQDVEELLNLETR